MKPGTVAHSHNPITREVEVGVSGLENHSQLHCEFEVNLGYKIHVLFWVSTDILKMVTKNNLGEETVDFTHFHII